MSLRDLLDKQKAKGNTNGQNIPSAQPISIASAPSPQVKSENNVGENGSGKTAEVVIADGRNGGQEKPPVLPAGLTGLALLKWKRENPSYAQVSNTSGQTKQTPAATQGGVGSNSTEVDSKSAATSSSKEPISPQNSSIDQTANVVGERKEAPEASASQKSDVTKTNDGVIDTEKLKANLAYLANNIDQKELVKDIVRTIAIQVRQNPALMAHFNANHGDMDLLVRGMRRSYALVARKKVEKKEETTGKKKVENELMESFKAAGFGDFTLDLKS
jgi:hypothetical protein